jgi:hypothetical protein
VWCVSLSLLRVTAICSTGTHAQPSNLQEAASSGDTVQNFSANNNYCSALCVDVR